MEWSVVSNAADRSSRTNMAAPWESEALRSYCTVRSAMYAFEGRLQDFSQIVEFLMMVETRCYSSFIYFWHEQQMPLGDSSWDYLGHVSACFRSDGNTQLDSDLLSALWVAGITWSRYSGHGINRHVGIGSKEHGVIRDLNRRLHISSTLAGWNAVRAFSLPKNKLARFSCWRNNPLMWGLSDFEVICRDFSIHVDNKWQPCQEVQVMVGIKESFAAHCFKPTVKDKFWIYLSQDLMGYISGTWYMITLNSLIIFV